MHNPEEPCCSSLEAAQVMAGLTCIPKELIFHNFHLNCALVPLSGGVRERVMVFK